LPKNNALEIGAGNFHHQKRTIPYLVDLMQALANAIEFHGFVL
jgi:hypothetical protein